MEDNSDKIEDLIKGFDFQSKNEFNWRMESLIKGINEDITIFSGRHKINQKSDIIYVRAYNLSILNDNNIKHILKVLDIVVSLKNRTYFPNVQVFLSKDHKYFYLCNKGPFVRLNLIYNLSGVLSDKNLIKWIIYQITFGLYFLHSNNIIHHDIKASNIYINEKGGIFIDGFDSAIFKNEKSISFTLNYSSPELLINLQADEKVDMWGLGIIMLELYCNEHLILKNENVKNREDAIRNILSFFGRNESYSNEHLQNLLKEDKNIEFTLKKEIVDQIGDKDAIDFLNNLLVFNPNKRFSAKEALESNYLKEFRGIDSFEIQPLEFPINYKELSKDKIDQKRFFEIIQTMIEK